MAYQSAREVGIMALKAVLFDVFGTLADLEQLGPEFAAQGLAADQVELFFETTLRDAFALDAAGRFVPFRTVAESALLVMGAKDPNGILAAMPEMQLRPDARPAFEHLRSRGLKVATLSNGAPKVTKRLLEKNGVAGLVSEIVSIEEIQKWKPRREVYEHGAKRIGFQPGEVALIAAHAWDIFGAMAAGLRGAWVSSVEGAYGPAFAKPDVSVDTLVEAARQV